MTEEIRPVLLVDDEPFLRLALVDLFEEAGLPVWEAGDADEAIALLQSHPEIRFVVTDVQMPGAMDGFRLARFIRDHYPPIALLICSGLVAPGSDDLPDGALFMSKPVERSSLFAEIDRLKTIGQFA